MNTPIRHLTTAALVVLALAFGLGVGLAIGQRMGAPPGLAVQPTPGGEATASAVASPTGLDQRLIDEAWETIERNYVDREAIEAEDQTYGAIAGMVESLGDVGHSRFLTPDMLRQQQAQTQGEYQGIGVEVQMREGEVVIVAPYDGSPAQRAGFEAGDVIVSVDGEEIAGLTLSEVARRLLGPAGTTVRVAVRKAKTAELQEAELTREKITIHPVSWARVPGTELAHLRISAFNANVAEEVNRALAEIKTQQLKGIILDLRNNPGGLVMQAVAAISEFLSGVDVLLVKNAQGEIAHVPAEPGGDATDIPLVVLVNGGSASSSEIMAGAIQDHKRGTVVGETTFGTGTVLNQFKLSDGSAMLLATEMWLTPSGRVIWHEGIAPDVVVELPRGVAPVSPPQLAEAAAGGLEALEDTQLLRAVELLRAGQ